jgi:putative ABC transport system permease protein
VIIAVASVVVVSNAFRVSAGERTRQFGILKSAGATQKQIASIILHEALFLCALGIPAGLLAGVLVQFTGTSIANYFLGFINRYISPPLVLSFTLSPAAIGVAAAGSLLTVMLSAWLPARRAAKIPAIDAIRRSGEVKLKRRQVRTSPLTGALFGFEGTLAAKSLKRSRRSFRATVTSLTISIVLLLATASLQQDLTRLRDLRLRGVNATALSYYLDEGAPIRPLPLAVADAVTARLEAYGGGIPVYGLGVDNGYDGAGGAYRAEAAGENRRVALLSPDGPHYAELCERAGVPVGSTLLLNRWYEQTDSQVVESRPFGALRGQTLAIARPDGTVWELTADGLLDEIPGEILDIVQPDRLYLVVPPRDAPQYLWYALAEDAEDFLAYAETVCGELADNRPEEPKHMAYLNLQEQNDLDMSIANLISVFLYGFVGMLILIALTNVISTISANTRLRAREFAVLRSVGLDSRGLRRMLNLESLLCSARALLFGLPLGLLGSYLIYRSMVTGVVVFPFNPPWLALAECVLGVFLVTLVSMRYSASRLRGQSIVETIRAE